MRNRLALLIALAVSALVAAAVATAHTTGGAQKAGDARSRKRRSGTTPRPIRRSRGRSC